ncbi:MAG: type II toxin-antitoxin system HicA family toxin [Pyrinomonadaceae bacterium MAG19_C2-C3]|nr:type II toxin-antitoxin system HicA family toxin [Pyrinomonadaceae bacterium MAG19_C2-C3]
MKYGDVAAKLKQLGCVEIPRRGGGSHRKWHNPTNNHVAPVPDWGSKDLKMGTVRHIVRQLDLDWEAFKKA